MAHTMVEVDDLDAGDYGGSGERFTRYVLEDARRSVRVLARSQQVLEAVARGGLSPAGVQASLLGYARDRGAMLAADIARAHARFASGLLHAVAGGPGHAPALPDFDPADPGAWFQAVSGSAAALGARALAACEAAARGEHPPGGPLSHGPQDLLDAASRTLIELLDDLGRLQAAYLEDCLAAVLVSARARGGEALRLAGRLGDAVSAVLWLENARSERAHLRCLPAEVRRADGIGPAFLPTIGIDPDALELDAGGEARVRVLVRLDEERFDPGAVYVGMLRIVRDGGETHLEVPMRIAIGREAPRQEASVMGVETGRE